MKINEAESLVGVTKKNIRYYEAEGLLSPRREVGNGYRSYSQRDVDTLRRIKLLRKLDVPLAEVKAMLEGQLSLREGMARHWLLLENRQAGLPGGGARGFHLPGPDDLCGRFDALGLFQPAGGGPAPAGGGVFGSHSADLRGGRNRSPRPAGERNQKG